MFPSLIPAILYSVVLAPDVTGAVLIGLAATRKDRGFSSFFVLTILVARCHRTGCCRTAVQVGRPATPERETKPSAITNVSDLGPFP